MSERDESTETRIAALVEKATAIDAELAREVDWLVGRYRRAERNLDKISRMSDRMQARILELNDKLRATSLTDPLTGLLNRRGALDALATCIRGDLSTDGACMLALIDIDHFKTVNDTLGHDAGDQVLADFAVRLKAALRAQDLAARWGGEEFLAILPDCPPDEARGLVEGLLEGLRNQPVLTQAGLLKVTASSGIARVVVGEAGHEAALARADKALYAAKRSGRDRCVMAQD